MLAPNFTLFDTNNQQKSLTEFHADIIMITFWVTWCPDCLKDLPQKNRLFESMDSSKVDMIMIHVTGRDAGRNQVLQFLKDLEFSFPVLFDEGTKVYDQYGCKGVPTTFLLDNKRNILAKFDEHATFLEIINKLSEYI
jgi:peroxiredoxin